MEVRFVARGTEIDAEQKSYMETKMSKLEKFFGKLLGSQVVVTFRKGNYGVETTANANGVMMRAEEHSQGLRKAFDQALKNLERQIKRHNEYLKNKGHFQTLGHGHFFLGDDGGEAVDWTTYDPIIEKIKKVPLHSMDAKEAVMQMELVGHNFFVFQNGETGDVNVVYKRKDGNYGQLVPIR